MLLWLRAGRDELRLRDRFAGEVDAAWKLGKSTRGLSDVALYGSDGSSFIQHHFSKPVVQIYVEIWYFAPFAMIDLYLLSQYRGCKLLE